MKVALLGAGKTGGKVAQLHENTVVFNSSNKPTLERLKECDIVISFLSGDIFSEYIPMLINSGLPVITGSTGFEWPQGIDSQLKEKNSTWVRAHNFSLGMNIVKSMIETLSKTTTLYNDASYSIHDIHHTKKLDAPSGTALSWKDWLGQDAQITSERTGDVVGYHHLEMTSSMESIKITHEAKDRAIFASGALWTAQKILNNKNNAYGLIHFSDVVKAHINI
jgi:4-hydroxy-tetrahydrodipicolinate reductase